MAMPAAAEDVLALYDACWFHRLVLLSPPSPAAVAAVAPASPPVVSQREEDEMRRPEKEREVKRSPSGTLRHRRTRSDEAAAFESLEPLRIPNSLRACRLETILSGKDGPAVPQPQPQPMPERRRAAVRRTGGRRRRQRRGRSMSELEFEEVKGLQDLGFTFSEDDVDAELASIVPGLRRRRSDEDDARKAPAAAAASAEEEAAGHRTGSAPAGASSSSALRRPYLSEAWDEEEEEEVRRMLRSWRIPPAGDGDGADLKEHLRLWAHTVASAVR
uniref:Uncharacterized protein n=1 Tax=Oryza punctata TaxID=4537 RepID=A0A0E0LCG6_ORYPU